jgi:hypothetical protein
MKSEYAAEQNNSPTCGNGKKGDGSGSWPCTLDQPCTGQTYNGHGRGMCQNGSARWATGLNLTNSTCTFGSSHGYGTKTWQQILSFYYPNWTLTTCSGTVVTPPSYDEPCNADPLTVDTSCNYVTKTIINATKSSQIPDASCDQPSNVDVWFKFTIPSETFRIHTNSISISSNDCGLAIYTGTCSSMIERYCVKGGNPSQPYMPWDDNINLSAYASQTAYIRIWEYGTVSQTGDFQICVTLTPTNETDHNTSIIPKFYKVSQNYPNPFNPSTIIMYDLPEGGMVSIKIYDMLGREVRTLVNEYKNAGSYNVEFNASNLPSGTYFYCLQAGSFAETKKLVLLR